ncbi:MAG: hypothetical protein ACRCYR_03800 [Phycicoccus sp.]
MTNPLMRGSYQELCEKIDRAVQAAFPEKRRVADEDTVPGYEWTYVEATFSEHVVISRNLGSGKEREFYRMPYTLTDNGDVELGEKQRVKLEVTVHDDDGETEPGPDDDALATRITPAVNQIAVATRLIGAAPEVKADSLGGLRTTVLELVDACAVKGIDMREALGLGEEDDDPDGNDPLDDDDEYESKDSEPTAGDGGQDRRVLLDQATVTAQIAELRG